MTERKRLFHEGRGMHMVEIVGDDNGERWHWVLPNGTINGFVSIKEIKEAVQSNGSTPAEKDIAEKIGNEDDKLNEIGKILLGMQEELEKSKTNNDALIESVRVVKTNLRQLFDESLPQIAKALEENQSANAQILTELVQKLYATAEQYGKQFGELFKKLNDKLAEEASRAEATRRAAERIAQEVARMRQSQAVPQPALQSAAELAAQPESTRQPAPAPEPTAQPEQPAEELVSVPHPEEQQPQPAAALEETPPVEPRTATDQQPTGWSRAWSGFVRGLKASGRFAGRSARFVGRSAKSGYAFARTQWQNHQARKAARAARPQAAVRQPQGAWRTSLRRVATAVVVVLLVGVVGMLFWRPWAPSEQVAETPRQEQSAKAQQKIAPTNPTPKLAQPSTPAEEKKGVLYSVQPLDFKTFNQSLADINATLKANGEKIDGARKEMADGVQIIAAAIQTPPASAQTAPTPSAPEQSDKKYLEKTEDEWQALKPADKYARLVEHCKGTHRIWGGLTPEEEQQLMLSIYWRKVTLAVAKQIVDGCNPKVLASMEVRVPTENCRPIPGHPGARYCG